MGPSRLRDLAYVGFFFTHIPIMLAVDLYPLYPKSVIPAWMNQLRGFYLEKYRDQNFINPSPGFRLFMWLEALYHVPLSLWAVGALWNDNPMVPVQLLIFGIEVFITTAACLAEVVSWENVSNSDKLQLTTLYGPYMALAALMVVDMYGRLRSVVIHASKTQTAKKEI